MGKWVGSWKESRDEGYMAGRRSRVGGPGPQWLLSMATAPLAVGMPRHDWATPVVAFLTWRSPAVPRSCSTSSRTLRRAREVVGVAAPQVPSGNVHRQLPLGVKGACFQERSRLTGRGEAQCLQVLKLLVGEGVVHLGQVNLLRRDPYARHLICHGAGLLRVHGPVPLPLL